MEGPGEYLKREREIREISLEDISVATKITVKALKALEADDFDSLPSYPFVKGFIRSYGKHIGIDGEDAVLRYEAYVREETERIDTLDKVKEKDKIYKKTSYLPQKITILLEESKKRTQASEENKYKYHKLGIIIAFLIIVSAVGIYLLLKPEGAQTVLPERNSAGHMPAIPEKLSSVKENHQTGVQEEYTEKETRKEDGNKSIAAGEDITLQINALKYTWMRVEIDDKRPFEVSLREGEMVSWKAKKGFSILIGNAGGVDAFFNGKPLGKLGKDGEVVRVNLFSPVEGGGNGE
jgi:cytoskeletal protein RodZ